MSGGESGAPADIDFANKSVNAERFLWDFGDGTTSREADPTHFFDRAGIYPVELTAFAEGDDGDISDTRVHVVILYQRELTDLKLEPALVVMLPDEVAQLTARAFDQFGSEIEGITLHWSSAGAARVEPTGVLRAGTRTGTFPQLVMAEATLGEVTMRVTSDVEIVPGPLHVVELTPAVTELSIGESVDFAAVGLDAFGNDVQFSRVAWTAAGRLGEIDSEGVLTIATTAGTFVVTARANTSQASASASATVIVRPDPFAGVVLTPSAATLQAGDELLFSAMAVDRHGNAIDDVVVTWLADPASGTVGDSGEFVADTRPGHHPDAVTVLARQGGVVKRASASVTLETAELATVLVEPASAALHVGAVQEFTLRAMDIYGNEIEDLDVYWSADPAAGRISSAGVFTANDRTGTYAAGVRVSVFRNGVAGHGSALVRLTAPEEKAPDYAASLLKDD